MRASQRFVVGFCKLEALMRAALLCLVLVAGCTKTNRNYCDNPPDNLCAPDAAPMKCDTTDDCDGDLVCKMPPGECVQCIDNAQCTVATAPICSMNTCGACTKHSDCPSTVCMDDGSCAAAADVLYVKQTGGMDIADCGSSTTPPCATVSYALMSKPAKTIVKVSGTITETNGLVLNDRDVTIHADPAAVLTRPGGNEIVKIENGSDVAIYDLQLSGASGTNGHAIAILGSSTGAITLKRLTIKNNGGVGVLAAGMGMLRMSQSTVVENESGGAAFEGPHTLDVTSNFFIYNGNALGGSVSDRGGVRVAMNKPGSKVEFNTIAFNQSSGNSNRGGFQCNSPMASASGNIVYRNAEPDGGGSLKIDMTTQINSGGTPCPFGSTLASPVDAQHLGFKNPITGDLDFHLLPTAPVSVLNAGGACAIRDVDGETRPMGGACDLGADELKQP
jgi:hypothetical protein